MKEYLGISGFSSRVQQKKQLRAQSCQVSAPVLPPHVLIKLPSVASTPLAEAEVALKGSKVFWVWKRCSRPPVTSRGFLSWGWASSFKDVCQDELSLQSWPCCYTRPVRLSPAPGHLKEDAKVNGGSQAMTAMSVRLPVLCWASNL